MSLKQKITKKREIKGYWIWLRFDNPSDLICKKLQNEVQKLIKSPDFKNHLTISGPYPSIDLAFQNALSSLSESINLFEINLVSYGFKSEYFESFFLKVENTVFLRDLKNQIDNILRLKGKKNRFFPHISLAYGEASDEVKARCINSLPSCPKSLTVNRIALIYADERVEKWNIIKEFKLVGNLN
tara:strand:+ start:2842 stop:3396 length:555 start_codon:yes stop_codon:yes gene_type:complete